MGRDRIERRIICIRAVLREPLQRGVDDLRILCLTCLITQSQPINCARSHILDEYIAFLQQVLHQLQAFRGLCVTGNGLLIHIHNKEAITVDAWLCLGISSLLARHRPFDLDDFRTEPCKYFRADGTCLKLCHVQNPVSA